MSARTRELVVLCACACVSVLAVAFGVYVLWGLKGLVVATATFFALSCIGELLIGVMAAVRRGLPGHVLRRLGNVKAGYRIDPGDRR